FSLHDALPICALQMYDDSLQYERALKWTQKKSNTRKKESYRKRKQRLEASLTRKGFTQHVIKEVIEATLPAKDDETEREALVFQGEKLRRKYERKFSDQALTNKLKEGL